MIDFLCKYDKHKPNFIELAIEQGKIEEAFSGEIGNSRLDGDQKIIVSEVRD
jgi:hypothetical protein